VAESPLTYIKRNACADLSLQDFQAQWKLCSEEDQATLREWALTEMDAK